MKIRLDGRARTFDNIFVEGLWRNVKYEDVYLNGYATMGELMVGLSKYFVLYNTERPHQSIDYKTPDSVYASASGGGALIIDKFAERQKNADPKTVCMTPVVDQLDG